MGDGGTAVFELWSFVWNDALTLRRVPPGVKPKPPSDVRVAGFADADGLWPTGNAGFAKLPSLVPGLLLLLPGRLMADAGLGGGPIGLSTEKKLDLRRSFGVVGTVCRLSIVLSDNEGRDVFRCLGVGGSSRGGSTYSLGWSSSRKPCLEAARNPSREPSRSLFSSASVAGF